MIKTELIDSALKLTGKTMEDMEIDKYIRTTPDWFCIFDTNFSIEKFSYYILSPEFIEKYQENCINDFESYTDIVLSELFWRALYLYQSGNEKHLIELLFKIWN